MITAVMLIALGGAPPVVDAGRICRNAQAAVAAEDAKSAIDSCVRDEENARDKLKERWPHYSASARAACSESGNAGVPLSYVEMWTCLEMQPGGSLSLNAASPGVPAEGSPDSAGLPNRLPPHAQPRPLGQ